MLELEGVKMTPLWNLFDRKGHGHCGTCEGDTKEDVERVARLHLGRNVDADLQRPKVNVPERKGWWNRDDE